MAKTLALDKLPTPLTDAACVGSYEDNEVPADFARSLEQRLSYAVGLLERVNDGPLYELDYHGMYVVTQEIRAFLALLRESGK